MDLSIIIPTYSRAHLLPRVVEAWQERIPEGVTAELVIVDDGSPDETPQVLRGLLDRWREGAATLRVERQLNSGLAGARNRGIEMSRGEVLIFSDDDMIPRSPEFVARHLDAQQDLPSAWVSRLVVPDSVVSTPFQRYWRRRLHGGTEPLPAGKDLGKGGFWFATLSIPRSLLGEDRFSGSFTEYGWEEHELGLRLHDRGVRARFLREAEVEHHDEVDFEGMRRKFRRMGRSAWVFTTLRPTLEVGIWTGTHRVSRALRRLIGQERRAARLLERDPDGLSDAQYLLCLEAAYAEGLREGRASRTRSRAVRTGSMQGGTGE